MTITSRTPARLLAVALAAALAFTGCTTTAEVPTPAATQTTTAAPSPAPTSTPSVAATTTAPIPTVAPMVLQFSLPEAARVNPDHRIVAQVTSGVLESVTVTSNDDRAAKKKVDGALSADKTSWRASSLLEPGDTYVVTAVAKPDDGSAPVTEKRTFTTKSLSNSEQVFVNKIPGDGATVGIAMPVVVTFDLPVVDKAAFETNMHVTSTPAQRGSWHWYSDTEAHWRPAEYWKSGTKVAIDIDVNGVSAGDGRFGQESRQASFTVGRAATITVDLAAHTLTQVVDGKPVKVIPVTGGKPGFDTRSGTKVIMEKFDALDMEAGTTGIEKNSPEYYDLKGVKYAMRVTDSGEFFHAAPWSISSQGKDNVSHGCVGMSTDNAEWLMENSLVGDPATYTGSQRTIEPGNGWSDWDISFDKYAAGSALKP